MKLSFGTTPAQRWLGRAPASRSSIAAIVVAMFAIAALGMTGYESIRLHRALSDADAVSAELTTRIDRMSAPRALPKDQYTKDQLQELNKIARQLNTPWPDVFTVLERRTPDTVALVAIEPDAGRQSVRVQAEARTLDELMAYVEALRDDATIEHVVLLEHETNERDVTRPVRLDFEIVLRRTSEQAP